MQIKLKSIGQGNFSKIKIPQPFLDNPPKPEKIIEKTLRFSRESELEDIIVDEYFNLLDGYSSYLIAQQVGAEFVKIKMVDTGRKRRWRR